MPPSRADHLPISSGPVGYRSDIDGLRAIAVVPVVLYHAGISTLSGGFVGVDVFFVISGFLITSMLVADIDRSQFSIIAFYERRARRIFPALFFLLLVALVAFFVILDPLDFKSFAKSVVSTVAFSSNIVFYREAGYFDAPSELKPLLHTWSLAVEEQFYIGFPVLLYFLSKRRTSTIKVSLLVIAALSLILSTWGVRHAPAATFYFVHTRAWELLIGSLLAISFLPTPGNRYAREIGSFLGLALIGYSVFSLSPSDPFPGLNAMAPCIGAGMIIWSGFGGQSFVGCLLSVRPIVFIGKISYSLYLWHWPVIIFTKYLLFRDLTVAESALAIAISFVSATLSWRYIEQPFRVRGNPFTRGWILVSSAVAMTILGSAGMSGYLMQGWPERVPYAMPIIEKYANYDRKAYRPGTCLLRATQGPPDYPVTECFGDPAPDILIWGDSFGAHLYSGLARVTARSNLWVGQATSQACAPVLGMATHRHARCQEFTDFLIALIRENPPRNVLLSARWELLDPADIPNLTTTIRELKSLGINVFVVGQSPTFQVPAYRLYLRNLGHGAPDTPVESKDHKALNDLIERISVQGGAAYFSPEAAFCEGTSCRIERNENLLFWDDGHLTLEGSVYLSEAFFEQYGPALSR